MLINFSTIPKVKIKGRNAVFAIISPCDCILYYFCLSTLANISINGKFQPVSPNQ